MNHYQSLENMPFGYKVVKNHKPPEEDILIGPRVPRMKGERQKKTWALEMQERFD